MARGPGRPRGKAIERIFGPLELRVLETLWRVGHPSTVRAVQEAFPGVAYTTLMTTLDRLHKKEVLHRTKTGRAYAYEPRWRREEMELRLAASTIRDLLQPEGALEPLLSCFVDAVSERDRLLLDQLERLVEAKRRKLDPGDPR